MSKVTIKFEGEAGSGKTTLSNFVSDLLKKAGLFVSADEFGDDASYDTLTVEMFKTGKAPISEDAAVEAIEAARFDEYFKKEERPRNPALRAPVVQGHRYEDHYHADGTPKRMREDGSKF